jgi:hypothetical protein
MTRTAEDAARDPFGERQRARFRIRAQLLGARFVFESDNAQLMRIVRQAYGGLPPHRLGARPPRLRVRLVLLPAAGSAPPPPLVHGFAAPGLVGAGSDGSCWFAAAPGAASALLAVSPAALGSPYHLRYELLEFAVYLLAARAQRLVPLHAGCVGRSGAGVLLVGATGAGKSTLTLECIRQGLDFLAEDSVLLEPRSLRATGISSFLHLREDALRFLPARAARAVRRAPVIHRRSGIAKFEIDLRRGGGSLARAPLRLRATVFLAAGTATGPSRMRRLAAAELRARLRAEQPYASSQPGWRECLARLARLPAYELRRGAHPRESLRALEALLGEPAASADPHARRRSRKAKRAVASVSQAPGMRAGTERRLPGKTRSRKK